MSTAVERHWGFVDGVFKTPEELLAAAAGLSGFKEASEENLRPAGEGVYALVLHGNHTHLAYVLELPSIPVRCRKRSIFSRRIGSSWPSRTPMRHRRRASASSWTGSRISPRNSRHGSRTADGCR